LNRMESSVMASLTRLAIAFSFVIESWSSWWLQACRRNSSFVRPLLTNAVESLQLPSSTQRPDRSAVGKIRV
jgi:hypothetical protein